MALLLAVIRPGSTAHLGFVQGLAHWLLHITAGLICAILAMQIIQALTRKSSPVLLLLLSGSLGAWLFAPLAFGLEQWFPNSPPELDVGMLDRLEARGGALAVLAEGMQVWPQFLLVWIVLNLPPVLARFSAADKTPSAPDKTGSAPATTSDKPSKSTPESFDSRLLDRLPPAIGRELVSASSDLHYLNVHTTQGKAMIIGSLNALEEDLPDGGIRIHRGHWVAVEQVRRVDRSGRGWICETSDGRKLPISRRRVGEVRERLGSGFVRQDV